MIIFLLLFLPFISLKIAQLKNCPSFISPVILCYGTGIILANTDLLPNIQHQAELAQEVSILLAIPFLLFATDLIGWFKFAKSTILSFALIIISGLVATLSLAPIWSKYVSNSSEISGMLVGLYTGGIPNLNAIGKALNAPSELFIYLNAADIVTGGAYLIFLTSFAPFLYGNILKSNIAKDTDNQSNILIKETPDFNTFFKAFCLCLLIIGSSIGITYLWTGELKSVSLILLLLTTFSIFASLNKRVREWKGTFEIGEFFILIFCVAIGLTANFSLIKSEGLMIIFYTGSVLFTTVILHLFLCKFFKIDRDTMLITSVAALYGPPFIGQIASVIGNKKLIVSGMATGLVGYSIGNYLGIFIAQLVTKFL